MNYKNNKLKSAKSILMIRVPLLASIAFFIGAFVAPFALLQLALAMCGSIILLLAALKFVAQWKLQHNMRIREDAVFALIDNDVACAILTDARGIVFFANVRAVENLGASSGKDLVDLLSTVIADPAPIVGALLQRAVIGKAGSEEINTRNSHYRLSVSSLDETNYLWRFDDLTRSLKLQPTLPLATVVADEAGNIVHINSDFRTLLGRRPKQISEVFHDLPIRSGQPHMLETASGRTAVIVGSVALADHKRGIFVVPDAREYGNFIAPRAIGAGWDAIEDLPVPLLKVSGSGVVLASNREARALLDIADTDGKRLAEMLDGLGRPINDWLREAVVGRGAHISQFLRGRGDNQDTFVQVTLNTAGDTHNPHLIAVLNDVTELKTLEAQFVQSQKMQAIGQLAGGVAHDFNNLLTAISGHCDLLLLRHEHGDQNYGDLIQIHQNANRAASLVGQLLAFSRKQNLQPEIIDLRDTLSDLTHLLNRLVGEKVTLSLNHDPALAQIKADKRQLEQVLMNLVVNARDAMPAGGAIKVVTENLLVKSQLVRDRAIVPPGEYVVVKVIDEGHGIPPEKLPKIFEPFYTTKRTGEGTGLGLSTAYGIVKQTGGYIFAESEVDKGTQFSLVFPSYDLPVAEPISIPVVCSELTAKRVDGVILLVEDEAPVRAFASRALRLQGYTVMEADCGESALELLDETDLTVDIFVTDVIMPGMDGPTWVREALKKRPRTKVVFVSGYAEDAFRDGQSRIPNSVFLPKPFSLNALTATVHGQLQDELVSA